MSTVRVVWGAGSGPTRMAAYDAALLDAGIGDYNLVTVSSVLPADARLEVVGTAPDLGPAGNRLTVVESRIDREPGAENMGVASLGWIQRTDGHGLFYEATGGVPAAVEETLEQGLTAAQRYRDWSVEEPTIHVESVTPRDDAWTTQVVCAAYGESTPV